MRLVFWPVNAASLAGRQPRFPPHGVQVSQRKAANPANIVFGLLR